MLASALMSILVPAALTAAPAFGSAIQGDPPIRISLNQGGHYERGDKARVEVRTDRDGYLVVLHADPEGRVRVLFPLDPNDDNYVRAGKTYEVRSRGDREAFYIEQSNGTGIVFAAVSMDPFRVTDFVVGDHWDYRNLRVSDIASDAEADLTEIVQRMGSSAGFDYDVVYYEILEPVHYAYPTVFHSAWDYWDPYYSGCYYCGSRYYGTGIHIGIGFGSRYYDPWYYDPWYYSPRYYYPGYYYPTYYYPAYYYPRYYYPGYYGYGYRSSWPRYQNPYRFKDDRFRDGRFADNRRNRRAIDTGNRSQSRVTTNLVDYRRRSVDLSTGQRTSLERSRDAQVRRVAPDRNSEARRVQSENGRRVAPQSSRPRATNGAEPRRATPERTTPNRAEPRKAEPRRATPQRSTPSRAEPRKVEPRRATPQRSTPSRVEPRRTQPSQAAPARTNSSGRRVTQAERRTADWWTTADRASPARRVVTGRKAPATSRAVSRPQARTTTRSASQPRASTPARASAPSRGRAVSRPSVSRPTPSVSRAPSSRGSSSRGSVSQGRAPSRSGASSGGGSRRRN